MNEIIKKIESLTKKLEKYEDLEAQEEEYEAQEVLDDLEESLSINRALMLCIIQLDNKAEEMK